MIPREGVESRPFEPFTSHGIFRSVIPREGVESRVRNLQQEPGFANAVIPREGVESVGTHYETRKIPASGDPERGS